MKVCKIYLKLIRGLPKRCSHLLFFSIWPTNNKTYTQNTMNSILKCFFHETTMSQWYHTIWKLFPSCSFHVTDQVPRTHQQQQEEEIPEVDASQLKNPRYLKELLSRVRSPSAKAGVYLKYLSNCRINMHLNADTTIDFCPEDVTQLSRDPERADEVQ